MDLDSLTSQILNRVEAMTPEDRKEFEEIVMTATQDMLCFPDPDNQPQMDAYFCEADELFYGGCVSGETEFLTPDGWKRIDEYREGDLVAQWNEGGHMSFVKPLGYTNAPCESMISFSHRRLSMVLSDEHRVPVYDYQGNFTIKLAHELEAKPSRHTVPVNFKASGSGLGMSEDMIRLMVAIHADGNLTHRTKRFGAYCRVTLRKERKIERLLGLLSRLGIEYHEYRNPKRPTEVRYGFESPILTKTYAGMMSKISQSDAEIIFDEFSHWDGNITGAQGGDICFSTAIKGDADFIQFVAHCCGRMATMTVYDKLKENHSGLYKVNVSHYEAVASIRDSTRIERVRVDRMYCFKTPTTFWIARHNNLIFCTGNSAGGGKSFLGQCLALTAHTNSLLLRRQGKEADKFFDSLEEMIGNTDGRNRGSRSQWRVGERLIDIGGCNLEQDKQKYKGIPHDLIFFDELPDFHKSQFTFIKTWNRTTKEGQRCRIVCGGNPPTTSDGLWVIEYWAAWLDVKHPNPAKSGEIRHYISDMHGLDHEVPEKGRYQIDHANDKVTLVPDGHVDLKTPTVEYVSSRSRCFIRAKLSDNKYLMKTDYGAALDALPAEIRMAYRDGRFDQSIKDNPWQVIPTSWVQAAFDRWEQHPHPPLNIPQCAIAADPAQGGDDSTALAMRYDGWYDKIIEIPGRETPTGKSVAGLIVANRKGNSHIIIDMGGGYGSSAYETLKEQLEPDGYMGTSILYPYKGSEGSTERTSDGKLRFKNKRAAAYWKFREALDPGQDGGSRIMLPRSTRLLADLTAPKFWLTGIEINITPKASAKEGVETVKKILGRSPDQGDAVVMCWTKGAFMESHYQTWQRQGKGKPPPVSHGYAAKKRYLRRT